MPYETQCLTFRDSRKAFADAIGAGILNRQPDSDWFAGKWMYMHTDADGRDGFKNINTREYIFSMSSDGPLN